MHTAENDGLNFIDGRFLAAERWIDIENPVTGENFARQALGGIREVDQAVEAAKRCWAAGSLTSIRPVERSRMVRLMGDHLVAQKDRYACLLALETGKPLWEALIEVEGAARCFEYYASQAEALEGQSIPLGDQYVAFSSLEPHGVSAHIVPWNFPLEIAARSVAPALATGNSVIVKSPEIAPLAVALLGEAAEAAGLPPGALSIVCALGAEGGAHLTHHRDIQHIVFTGSVPTGRAVATAAAANVVPCILELGGKSAAIVHADADLDHFIDSVRWGTFYNAGQICSALSRAIVHTSVHDEVIDRLSKLASSIDLGGGQGDREAGLNMGALISEGQRDKVEEICHRATNDGASLITGGKSANCRGWFFQPTVFSNVEPASSLARNEVFGPVLAVTRFGKDIDPAALANATDYGLVAGVFTRDIDLALQTSRRLRAGQVFVNEWFAGGIETPFGGIGKSGYGREKGREGLRGYLQTKTVSVRLSALTDAQGQHSW